MNNIHFIVDSGQCDGCCECVSACSENNIFMLLNKNTGRPVPYAADECSGCGMCLSVCRQQAHYTYQT